MTYVPHVNKYTAHDFSSLQILSKLHMIVNSGRNQNWIGLSEISVVTYNFEVCK